LIFVDLHEKLKAFITQETNRLHDELADNVIEAVKKQQLNVDNIVGQWTRAYTEVRTALFWL
jgi:hypothetical protein